MMESSLDSEREEGVSFCSKWLMARCISQSGTPTDLFRMMASWAEPGQLVQSRNRLCLYVCVSCDESQYINYNLLREKLRLSKLNVTSRGL